MLFIRKIAVTDEYLLEMFFMRTNSNVRPGWIHQFYLVSEIFLN